MHMRYGIALFAMVSVASLSGCGQDDVTLPDQTGGNAGECGSWYPGGDTADDAGTVYSFAEGEILPCFVWESVGKGPVTGAPTTYLNMGEIFLQYKHGDLAALQSKFGDGIDDPRAIVLAISAFNCGTCPGFMTDLSQNRDALEGAGAILVGVARSDTSESNWLDFETADELLVDEGWDEDLHRTNDEERHLGTLGNIYPQVAVIDLETMTTILLADGSGYDAAGLVSFLDDNL